MDLRLLKEKVISILVIGKKYDIDRRKLIINRRAQKEEELQRKAFNKMVCIGIFRHHAVFRDSHGITESFVYPDLFKILIGEEECLK